jgi:hypothetical protein
VAEGGSLLNCYRVISSIEGSNPSVSAKMTAPSTVTQEPLTHNGEPERRCPVPSW